MTKEDLEAVFDRVRDWPPEKQAEAVEVLQWLDRGGGFYEPTEEEWAGIQRGLDDADNGRFASGEEVAAVFAKAGVK